MATLARGIITPEAVVLEFDTAGIASRALARAIDAVIQGVLLFALILVAAGVLGGDGWAALGLIILGVAFVVVGYPILAEVMSQGRSPGKAALGLRVVTVEGASISPRHAFIRSAIGIIDFVLVPGGLVAVVVALFSPRSQRLGDLFAGTMVLRERTVNRPSDAVWFNPPPGFEAYTTTLDVSPITEPQFALVRSYLLRIPDLSPEARASLSVRLATPLVAAMHHHTPPGVHADHFLQCVAAAYQRRHSGPPSAAPNWGPPPPSAPSDRSGTPPPPLPPPPSSDPSMVAPE
ncbi:MAG: RDD family protein [Acidimicrobiales bacterium]